MVARNNEDRHALVSHAYDGFHRHVYQRSGDFAAVEQITPMNHQVYSASEGRFQCSLKVAKKVGTSSSSFDTRPERKIEPKMSICDQKNTDR